MQIAKSHLQQVSWKGGSALLCYVLPYKPTALLDDLASPAYNSNAVVCNHENEICAVQARTVQHRLVNVCFAQSLASAFARRP
jgi:hypothetical protein